MKWLRLLFLTLFAISSSMSLAKDDTVRIDGKTYHTGLMKNSKKDIESLRFYSPKASSLTDLPEAFDARELGLATAIKNQGSCGSCWAFARARAFEAALIKSGHPDSVDLAEQDALVNDRNAYGCNGGFMDGRFETNLGVTTEALCPYRGSGRYACNGAKYAHATRWAMVGASNRAPTDDELKAAIYQYGTLAVTVSAGGSFSPNSEGRITSCRNGQINHMVTLQGWRPSADGNGVEFLIGNSWGESWGKQGYAWSKRGCNALASTPGDAALFYYVEGDGPVPQPANMELPVSISARRGQSVALHVKPEPNVAYTWSTGSTGEMIWVQPSADTTYVLKATDGTGNVTEQSVRVTLQ